MLTLPKLTPTFSSTPKFSCSFLIDAFLAINSHLLIFTIFSLKSTTKINKKRLSNNKKSLPKINLFQCSIKWQKLSLNLITNSFNDFTILSFLKKFNHKMEKSITVESWFLMLQILNYWLNKACLKLQNTKMNSNIFLSHIFLKTIGRWKNQKEFSFLWDK